jgi:dTDP-4-amino-4,6-dideoxygalactose transaminase
MQSVDAVRQIPFFRYPHVFGQHRDEYVDAMMRVLEPGAFILQEDVALFERELSAYLGCRHAIGVANATDALTIVLRALGVGPGDEVIVPAHTFVASAAAIHWAGATPVVCDIGADHLMDPTDAERLISSRTKALMPVQLNGRTSDMDRVGDVARRHGLQVVEDSSQALGSRFKGRCAGTWGRAGVFSFYPAKLIGAFGDAGAIVTDDDALAAEMRLLRDHGRSGHGGEVQRWGMNSRLDTVHAAVLRVKLRHYGEEIVHRRAIAEVYQQVLRHQPGVQLPPVPGPADPHFDVFQNFEIQSDRRDALKALLESRGVRTIMQWAGKGLHQFPALGLRAHVPRSDRFFQRCLLLPMNSSVTLDEAAWVARLVSEFHDLPGGA